MSKDDQNVRPKFNLDDYDIGQDSSDDSKFNLDKDDDKDVIDNFESIGVNYAGSGLTPNAGKAPKISVADGNEDADGDVDAYHANFHRAANMTNSSGDEDATNPSGLANRFPISGK